jgi:hypothetical protein
MNALATETKTSVKVIGANGQISLGKEYAGRQVLVEEREPGVWFVRTAIVIPATRNRSECASRWNKPWPTTHQASP